MCFIQATKGNTCTHDVIFTNGRKKLGGSVCSALDWSVRLVASSRLPTEFEGCVLGHDILSRSAAK